MIHRPINTSTRLFNDATINATCIDPDWRYCTLFLGISVYRTKFYMHHFDARLVFLLTYLMYKLVCTMYFERVKYVANANYELI